MPYVFVTFITAFYHKKAGVMHGASLFVDYRDVRYRPDAKVAECLDRFYQAFLADGFLARNMLMGFMLKRLSRETIDTYMGEARKMAVVVCMDVVPASEPCLNEYPDHEQLRRDRRERRYFSQRKRELGDLLNRIGEMSRRNPDKRKEHDKICDALRKRRDAMDHVLKERKYRLEREQKERIDLQCEAHELDNLRLEVEKKMMSSVLADKDWSAEMEPILFEKERAFERKLEQRTARLRKEFEERCTAESEALLKEYEGRYTVLSSEDDGDLRYDTMDTEEHTFFENENKWLFSTGLARMSVFLDKNGERIPEITCEGEVEDDYDESTFIF